MAHLACVGRQAAEFFMSTRPLDISKAAAKDLTDAQHLRSIADDVEKYTGDWNPEALETYIKGALLEPKSSVFRCF